MLWKIYCWVWKASHTEERMRSDVAKDVRSIIIGCPVRWRKWKSNLSPGKDFFTRLEHLQRVGSTNNLFRPSFMRHPCSFFCRAFFYFFVSHFGVVDEWTNYTYEYVTLERWERRRNEVSIIGVTMWRDAHSDLFTVWQRFVALKINGRLASTESYD